MVHKVRHSIRNGCGVDPESPKGSARSARVSRCIEGVHVIEEFVEPPEYKDKDEDIKDQPCFNIDDDVPGSVSFAEDTDVEVKKRPSLLRSMSSQMASGGGSVMGRLKRALTGQKLDEMDVGASSKKEKRKSKKEGAFSKFKRALSFKPPLEDEEEQGDPPETEDGQKIARTGSGPNVNELLAPSDRGLYAWQAKSKFQKEMEEYDRQEKKEQKAKAAKEAAKTEEERAYEAREQERVAGRYARLGKAPLAQAVVDGEADRAMRLQSFESEEPKSPSAPSPRRSRRKSSPKSSPRLQDDMPDDIAKIPVKRPSVAGGTTSSGTASRASSSRQSDSLALAAIATFASTDVSHRASVSSGRASSSSPRASAASPRRKSAREQLRTAV